MQQKQSKGCFTQHNSIVTFLLLSCLQVLPLIVTRYAVHIPNPGFTVAQYNLYFYQESEILQDTKVLTTASILRRVDW